MRWDVKRGGQASGRGGVVDVRDEQVGRDGVRDGLMVVVVTRVVQRQVRVQWVLQGAQTNGKRKTHFTQRCSYFVGLGKKRRWWVGAANEGHG